MTIFSETFQKIGLTQKGVNHLVIMQIINKKPMHGADIYRLVSENSRRDPFGPTRSRTYIYKTIDDLEKEGLIQFHQEGRKKVFSLTDVGHSYLDQYKLEIIPVLNKQADIIAHKKKSLISRTVRDSLLSPTDHEKAYLSRVLNVKLLIGWYSLHRLMEEESIHGGSLYKGMEAWIGWKINHGYLYQILREMNHDDLLSSYWLDEDKRSQREYQITAHGRDEYETISMQLEKHLNEVYESLIFMIKQFD